MRLVFPLFLALSILGGFSHSVAIIEPDPDSLDVDFGSMFFVDDEVPTSDCPSYNFDMRSNGKLRARGDRCGMKHGQDTAPELEPPVNGQVNPANERVNQPTDNSNEVNPSQQPKPSDLPIPKTPPPSTEFWEDPHAECLKYLGHILKYAVCDSGHRDDVVWSPLPEVLVGVPLFELRHCTLGTFGLEWFGSLDHL